MNDAPKNDPTPAESRTVFIAPLMQDGLVDSYRQRLFLSNTELSPSVKTLGMLMERHLEFIPFENLSQYDEEPIVLERTQLIEKLLKRKRGGCCLELNGLFAMFLRGLGYKVWLVPCFLFAGSERGHASNRPVFRTTASHFMLLVQVDSKRYMVDVGLGEPAMGPLEYTLGKEQTTCDGLCSRIVWDPQGTWIDGKGNKKTCLVLDWLKDGCWEHRLQWDVKDAPLDQPPTTCYDLESFRYVIDILLHEKSSFARKSIVCKLTRDCKTSLAGNRLKRTQPRVNGTVSVVVIHTDADVTSVLEAEFGISESGCVDAIRGSEFPKLWKHL